MTWIGILLVIGGFALRIWAGLTLRKEGVTDLHGISLPIVIVSKGPYTLLEHPMYVGSMMVIGGVGVVAFGIWGVTLALPAYPFFEDRIHRENELLKRYRR